jgi:hypothetical protein
MGYETRRSRPFATPRPAKPWLNFLTSLGSGLKQWRGLPAGVPLPAYPAYNRPAEPYAVSSPSRIFYVQHPPDSEVTLYGAAYIRR